MFDILCDVWARPGSSHSPIVPLDLSGLSADDLTERISLLHKCGLDALLLTCRDGVLCEGLLEAAFAAAAKRFMLVFIHEDVICTDMGCNDEAFVAYNPMMRAHTLRLSRASETRLSHLEEISASYYVKRDGDAIVSASGDAEDEELERLDVILTDDVCGIDLLSPESGEMMVSIYDAFYEKYKDVSGKALAGIMTSRLKTYSPDRLSWSYDMIAEHKAYGGTPMMLLSLLAETDKRSRKEGRRIFGKTLAARLDDAYLSPLSNWCGRNSLAFMGEVPYDFIGTCGRRFTLSVYSDECFEDVVTKDSERMSAIQCLGDVARTEGFTGVAYRCTSPCPDKLVREALMASAASASLFLLPAELSSPEYLSEAGIRPEDMKRVMGMLRRLSTLNTSCSSDTSCAVLCDDGFVPLAGADKLRELGVPFNFLTLAQASERGHSHDGEFLIDRFRYSSFLIDQRVRMDPAVVKQIGEATAYGAQMYRGGQFGDFAKKHLCVNDFDRELSKSLLFRHTVKCGHRFTLAVNGTLETVKIKYPARYPHAAYILDPMDGTFEPLLASADGDVYVENRVKAGGVLVLAWNFDAAPHEGVAVARVVREIHALHDGDSIVDFRFKDGEAVIELDSFDGDYVYVRVNGSEVARIISPPYTVDVTSWVSDGENTITLSSNGKINGAVLRLL